MNVFVALFLVPALLCPSGWAEDLDFDARAATLISASFLKREHLAKHPLDNEVSQKWLHRFINRLDPHRKYFVEGDFQDFLRYEHRLDDFAKDGNMEFADLVLKQYRKRVNEAAGYAQEFLSAKHDYTTDEVYPDCFDTYATDSDQLRDRWRLRIKAELVIEKVQRRPAPEVRTQLQNRYRRIARQAREMSSERWLETYLDSLATVYDPHTSYLGPTIMSSFSHSIKLRRYSLGLIFREQQAQLIVHSVVPVSLHSPSQQDKLLGYLFTELNLRDLDEADMFGGHGCRTNAAGLCSLP